MKSNMRREDIWTCCVFLSGPNHVSCCSTPQHCLNSLIVLCDFNRHVNYCYFQAYNCSSVNRREAQRRRRDTLSELFTNQTRWWWQKQNKSNVYNFHDIDWRSLSSLSCLCRLAPTHPRRCLLSQHKFFVIVMRWFFSQSAARLILSLSITKQLYHAASARIE